MPTFRSGIVAPKIAHESHSYDMCPGIKSARTRDLLLAVWFQQIQLFMLCFPFITGLLHKNFNKKKSQIHINMPKTIDSVNTFVTLLRWSFWNEKRKSLWFNEYSYSNNKGKQKKNISIIILEVSLLCLYDTLYLKIEYMVQHNSNPEVS